MLRRIRLIIFWGVLVIFFGGAFFYLPDIFGDVFYPLPQPELLSSMRVAAEEFSNVPISLIVAVAKHESGFRAEALSPAGARGVMQIMPATGTGLARELRLENYTANSLFDPTINIRLGTHYLSRLLTKYNGDVRSTLAHYNAGPRGPDLLRDTNRELKVYRGVEGYARRVVATQAVYEQLYGKNIDFGPTADPLVKPEKSFIDQIKEVRNLLPLLFN